MSSHRRQNPVSLGKGDSAANHPRVIGVLAYSISWTVALRRYRAPSWSPLWQFGRQPVEPRSWTIRTWGHEDECRDWLQANRRSLVCIELRHARMATDAERLRGLVEDFPDTRWIGLTEPLNNPTRWKLMQLGCTWVLQSTDQVEIAFRIAERMRRTTRLPPENAIGPETPGFSL